MSSREVLFEVRVKEKGQFKTYHYHAKSPEQAMVKSKKNGRIISVRKADKDRIFGNIELLDLRQQPLGAYLGNGMHDSDIKLDEVFGLRKKIK